MKTFTMNKNIAILLRILIMLIGIGTLFLMLWLPHLEGRNDGATVFEIYFNDPFLAYVYLASIAYFFALFQMFKLVGYAARRELLTIRSAQVLRSIKYCALVIIGFIVGAEIYFFAVQSGKDDIAGGVMMGFFMILVATVVFVASSKFERNIRKTLESSK